MGTIRRLKKSIAENKFIFPLEMYTSLPGSIVVTAFILSNERPDVVEIRKRWKKLLRHGLDFDLQDPEYIQKVCKLFDVDMFDLKYAAFVQSDFNALVCPYFEGHILPLREDGLMTRTLRTGKIYPLTEKVAKNGSDTEHLEQSEGQVQ